MILPEKAELRSGKGVRLAADYYEALPSDGPRGWIVYVHMMPATKESWRSLASYLAEGGYSGVAIDLRGHGGSEGGPDGYRNFSDQEHQASLQDLEDAEDFLKSRGADPKKIIYIGASIGANLSLVRASEHPEQPGAVLFSPGLNYRGIETAEPVRKLQEGMRVFFIASRDDGNNAGQAQLLYDAVPSGVMKKIEICEVGGHGTDILDRHPDLMEKIFDFLRQ